MFIEGCKMKILLTLLLLCCASCKNHGFVKSENYSKKNAVTKEGFDVHEVLGFTFPEKIFFDFREDFSFVVISTTTTLKFPLESNEVKWGKGEIRIQIRSGGNSLKIEYSENGQFMHYTAYEIMVK